MRQHERFLAHAIVRHEQPLRAARFERVESIACDGLRGLVEQGERVPAQQPRECRISARDLSKAEALIR